MRKPRLFSSTGIYHVMIRGNEKKNIFHEDKDRLKFLNILSKKSKDKSLIIYGYCLMDNHVHLVIKEGKNNISTIMRSINTRYAQYFNRKYNRTGHVFQDRFKSEVIENDVHLFEVIRYVHNNPLKANIVKDIKNYSWSSYRNYLKESREWDLLEVRPILNMFSNDNKEAKLLFEEHSKIASEGDFIDIKSKKYDANKKLLTIEDVEEIILEFLQSNNITYNELIENREKRKLRNNLIHKLKLNSNFSNRELAQVLKINRNIIQRVK